MISIICGIQNKNKISEQAKQTKLTDKENKLMVDRQQAGWGTW